MTDGTPGNPVVIVTWLDGTTTTYTMATGQTGTFSHTGNEVKFTAYPANQPTGEPLPTVLNFGAMRGYVKVGFPQ